MPSSLLPFQSIDASVPDQSSGSVTWKPYRSEMNVRSNAELLSSVVEDDVCAVGPGDPDGVRVVDVCAVGPGDIDEVVGPGDPDERAAVVPEQAA